MSRLKPRPTKTIYEMAYSHLSHSLGESHTRNTNYASPFPVETVQLEKLDRRRLLELDAELAGDFAKGVVEVREVVDGHVANEGAANFVVARAAVQPAQEEKELKARREDNGDPVRVHRC